MEIQLKTIKYNCEEFCRLLIMGSKTSKPVQEGPLEKQIRIAARAEARIYEYFVRQHMIAGQWPIPPVK